MAETTAARKRFEYKVNSNLVLSGGTGGGGYQNVEFIVGFLVCMPL